MANAIQPWAEFVNGAIPLREQDNGDGSYSWGTSALGDGVAVPVNFAEVIAGKYPIIFVDNGDGSFLLGTTNG